jgi:hypothetical protein
MKMKRYEPRSLSPLACEAYSNCGYDIYTDGVDYEIRDGGDVVRGELTLEEVDEWFVDEFDRMPENIHWMDDDQLLRTNNASQDWDWELLNEIIRRASVWAPDLEKAWEEDKSFDEALLIEAYDILDHGYGKVINLSGTDIDFEAAAQFMDDEIREDLHDKLAPCTDQTFFTDYEKAHWQKFDEMWEMSKSNPTW